MTRALTSHWKRLAIGAVVFLALLTAGLTQNSSVQAEQRISKKELKVLIATASTPADHQRIAAYYRAEADGLSAKKLEHEQDLAEYYKNSSRYPSKYPSMGDHCRTLIDYYGMAAQKALKMAEARKPGPR